jgi:hypothetical protein
MYKMDYSFPFVNYYSNNFVDPLYQKYGPKKLQPINPYLENSNEFMYGKGLRYKKRVPYHPCQIGYKEDGYDFCVPNFTASNFYINDVHTLDPIRPGIETFSLRYDSPIINWKYT